MLPWIEKYRPSKLDDVIGNYNIIKQFKSISEKGNMPHMLLVGPPGTGKTTSITCLARELLGSNFVEGFLELNASNERGIDIVRNKIKDFCKKKLTLPIGIHKIIFLDEVESMTSVAQQALRRIIEQYTRNTRFSMACNSSSQMIEPIQSRCTIKRFSRIKEKTMLKRLVDICKLESVGFTDNGLKSIITNINGDMRRALNILQATSTTYNKINTKNVNKIINKPENCIIEDIFKMVFKKNFKLLMEPVSDIIDKYSALDIIHTMFNVIKDYNMNDELKLRFIREIGKSEIYLIQGADSKIQLMSLLAKLCLLV